MENQPQVIFGDEIELLDKTRIKCCPLSPEPEINCPGEDSAMNFSENIKLFISNADRIFKDSRMFLAPVPVHSSVGPRCCAPVLGAYLEWWLNFEESHSFEPGAEGVIWRFAGSPLSGMNSCSVYDGTAYLTGVSVSDISKVCSTLIQVNRRYSEARQLFQAFSLEEVVSILSSSGKSEEMMSLNFRNHLLHIKCVREERLLKESQAELESVKQKFFNYICEEHRLEVMTFWKEYSEMNERLAKIESDFDNYRTAKRKEFKAGEIPQKSFQRDLKARKDEHDAEVEKINAILNPLYDGFCKKMFGGHFDYVLREMIEEYVTSDVAPKDKSARLWSGTRKAVNDREDVMKHFFGIGANGHTPMVVWKTEIDRMINKYGKNGFICISAYRSEALQEENDRNAKALLKQIQQSGYCYLPVYDDNFDPSFIVFNYDKDGVAGDLARLFDFGKPWLSSNQGDVLQDCIVYVNPPHTTLNERMMRSGRNEILFL